MNKIEKNKFNLGLSILILIDLILIVYTLIYNVTTTTYYNIIVFDIIVCILLIFEFNLRLFKSENKRKFFIHNWSELIAAIPFDLIIFPLVLNYEYFLKLLIILKFIKVIALVIEFLETIDVFLKKTHLDEILGVTLLVIIVSTLAVYLFDPSINNLFDSLWFVLSTITTVGYGDVLPNSNIGRILGLIILTFGVFIFSAVTGAMTSYFTRKLFSKEDFNITKNDENIKILKEDLAFNKNNLNKAHDKLDKTCTEIESIKRELNETKQELSDIKKELIKSNQLNKKLEEEIINLNEILKK
jgi:voltage-gated potassium channel